MEFSCFSISHSTEMPLVCLLLVDALAPEMDVKAAFQQNITNVNPSANAR